MQWHLKQNSTGYLAAARRSHRDSFAVHDDNASRKAATGRSESPRRLLEHKRNMRMA